jgi:hypothetical protein
MGGGIALEEFRKFAESALEHLALEKMRCAGVTLRLDTQIQANTHNQS